MPMINDCELCGDADGRIFLRSRCHMTAPLMARKEGDVLILSCYVPDCGREVARLQLRSERVEDQKKLEAIVRQLVIEWDAPNASTSLKFLEAIRRARKAVGLTLAQDDDVSEAALLQAHGYEI